MILIPLGVSALFGTTILGWVAVAQIRRSAGKIYGRGLALFDGLLFPVLALDSLIVWLAMGFTLGFPEAVLLCLFIDGFLIWKIWRVLNLVSSSEKTSAPFTQRFGWLPIASLIALVALIFAGVFVKAMVRKETQARADLKKELTEQIAELLAEKRIIFSRLNFEFSPVLPRAFVTFTKLEDWRNRTNGEPHSLNGALHLTFDDPDACIVRGRGDLAHVQHQFATPLGRRISWPRRVGATENEQFVSDKQFSIASSNATNQTPRTEFAAAALVPVIERTVNDIDEKIGKEFLVLESGELLDFHEDQFKVLSKSDQEKWLDDRGVNVCMDTVGGRRGLGLRNLTATLVTNEAWDWDRAGLEKAIRPNEPGMAYKDRGGFRWHIFPTNAPLPMTFALRTGAGRLGVLQVLTFTDYHGSVKIRYKLVHSKTNTAATGSKRQRFVPADGMENKTSWGVLPNRLSSIRKVGQSWRT
ncbi:MAG: hypothetical protein M3Y82_12700 [Verrucomicrobiota bacterium]|nr:hypothetical protein [Verrucomicrobiota bacterium]